MIKEAFVSFEVAKLLKEKGFNEKCRGGYHCEFDDNDHPIVMLEEWTAQPYNNDFVDEGFLCSAPTHQLVTAWLREKHNICITIYPDKENGYESVLYDIENNVEIVLQSFGVYGIHIYKEIYEDAVEAALKYCLENLIKT